MSRRPSILVVEDNPADVFLIRAAINAARVDADLLVAKDGEQALRFFDAVDADDTVACPALVLLDINLPRKRGGEILKCIRQSGRSFAVLVIAVSSSDSPQDREGMMKLGADGYFRKPSNYAEFMSLGDMVKRILGV